MALQSAVGSSLQDKSCFFGSTHPCRHCSHPFQPHEGVLLAGKRDKRNIPNGFLARSDFVARAECQKREERARAAPCACSSKPEVFPHALDTRFPSPSALRAKLLLSLMISFPKMQWAASATSHVDRRWLGGRGGGVLHHEDNKIMPVMCCDLLLCLVASIISVSLHSICSGFLSFTLFCAAAATQTFPASRRS